ncbi:hypothetical protein Tco_1264127 [Tanacetum coccineum]
MSSSSTVTYTYVYIDFEPGRVFWGADEELSDGVLADAEVPLEDQPLPTDALPTALSPGYMTDFDPKEDPEEDPEEDHADYPADGGDDDDEPSDNDDDDTDDEDEENFEDEDDKSPQTKVPFAQTRLCRARKTVRLEPPMSPSMESHIVEYAAAPAPPLPPPPSSLHLPPPIPTSLPLPSLPVPPLPSSLFIPPPVDRREDIPEAELPPRKRLCLTALTLSYEVGESSTAAPRPTKGPTEAVEVVAPTTLEGVNARVTELAAVQEQDTQDVYAVIEDTQDRQT